MTTSLNPSKDGPASTPTEPQPHLTPAPPPPVCIFVCRRDGGRAVRQARQAEDQAIAADLQAQATHTVKRQLPDPRGDA